jgi:hypothetical protein
MIYIRDLEYYIYVASSQIEYISISPNCHSDIMQIMNQLDWPDRTVGLGPDRTGLILVQSGPKVKDRTVKQSPFLVRTGLKLL